jgi:hypothetical protein
VAASEAEQFDAVAACTGTVHVAGPVITDMPGSVVPVAFAEDVALAEDCDRNLSHVVPLNTHDAIPLNPPEPTGVEPLDNSNPPTRIFEIPSTENPAVLSINGGTPFVEVVSVVPPQADSLTDVVNCPPFKDEFVDNPELKVWVWFRVKSMAPSGKVQVEVTTKTTLAAPFAWIEN